MTMNLQEAMTRYRASPYTPLFLEPVMIATSARALFSGNLVMMIENTGQN